MFKKINQKLKEKVETEIKMMLHAHRDCLRNQEKDTTEITFKVTDGYYGECFGIMRCLQLLGYGVLGSCNVPGGHNGDSGIKTGVGIQPEHNLRWWLCQIEDKVLKEENFRGSNECDYCLEHYRKDAVRTKPW